MSLRDESHTLFGTVVDSDGFRGVWIEVTAENQKPDDAVGRDSLLIPWSNALTIVVADKFPLQSVRKPEESASPTKPDPE